MKWSTLLGLSVHDKSLPFDRTCCLDKSELETCLRFPCLRFLVSCNRSHKQQQWESFFLVPRPPTVQFDVVHQLLDLRHKQHLIFCAQHVLHLHVLLDSRDSSGSFLLWEPLLSMVLRLHRVPLDVFTVRLNRFNGVTMCARSMFSFFVGHPSAMLYHDRFLDAENYSQCWSLWMSLICSKKRKKMLSSM